VTRAITNRPRGLGVALACGGLAALLLGVGAWIWLDASLALPLVALTIFTAIGAIAWKTVAVHHPFDRLGPANGVTLARAALVAVTTGLVIEAPSGDLAWTVVAFASVAVVLDGVDGWLARRSRMASAFGSRLDMEVDAFLILVLSVLVWRHHKAGVWVLGIGLMRYAFVAAGWPWPWLAKPLRSTMRGKTVAVVQVVGLILAVSPVVPTPWSAAIGAIALGMLAWSFWVDVRLLSRQR
jgi:phosphatidylglycerophosphate synthase